MEGKRTQTRARRQRDIVQVQPSPSLDEALAYIQEHRLALHFDADHDFNLWSPHSDHVPIRVRRALRRHPIEVVELMLAGSMSTCPNPALHRRRMKVQDRRAGRCTVCMQLVPEMFNREVVKVGREEKAS